MTDLTKNLIDTISKVADIVKEKDLEEIHVAEGDVKISIKAKLNQSIISLPNNLIAPAENVAGVGTVSTESKPIISRGNIIKSPIIGVFYAAPSPDKPPFVQKGDIVEKGQVICIIESMKLMNEIQSEFSGTVVDVFVKDGEGVEFEQDLLLIE